MGLCPLFEPFEGFRIGDTGIGLDLHTGKNLFDGNLDPR